MADNPMEIAQYQNDHDLLVALSTEMRLLRLDIGEMKNDGKATLADHEARLRFIERWMWGAIAILGLLEFALQVYSNIHK